jgi:hypothetical protein
MDRADGHYARADPPGKALRCRWHDSDNDRVVIA